MANTTLQFQTLPSSSTQAPLNSLNTNQYNLSSFSYPLDLFTNPALQHYVIFYIDVPTTSSSSSQTPNQGQTASNPEGSPGTNTDGSSSVGSNSLGTPTVNQNPDSSANNTQSITRTNVAIALYMPNLVTTDTNNWQSEELGAAGVMGGELGRFRQIAADFKAKDWSDIVTQAGTISKEVGGAVFSQMGRKLLQEIGSITDLNILGAIGASNREAYNSHLEVLYQGPTFRTFNFQFQMTPRSAQEAQAIANIIKAFRYYAAPDLSNNSNGLGRYFIYPAEFDIQFYSFGQPNTFLNKISTCACTSISVDYSNGHGWTAFKQDQTGYPNTNGVPIQTTLTLQFLETEVMTKTRINSGF